jgi:predicted RNA-binding Zn ribbon-like protein
MTTASPVDDRFRLIGGRPCLNLIATYGKRHTAQGIERLPDGETLLDWLIAAGILPIEAAGVPAVSAAQLETARALRESTNRLVRTTMAGARRDAAATMAGRRPDPAEAMAGAGWDAADVDLVNRMAAGRDLAPRLGRAPGPDGGGTVDWGGHHPVDAALSALARDAVDLLNGSRTGRIKECEHPECSLLFFDDSQSGRRRWCSMDRCGNLVKIAGYRQRVRD